jgi:hypothetical protein
LHQWLIKKRGWKTKFLSSKIIYLSVAQGGHWYLYVLFHPNKIINNLSAVPATETLKSTLIVIDFLNGKTDRPNDAWIHQIFCFMFTYYLNTETEPNKTVVTPKKLPMVKVKRCGSNLMCITVEHMQLIGS